MSKAELVARIQKDGEYLACRELPDGSIACIGDLLYTRAIFLNCDEYGYSTRFCFEDRGLALLRFTLLESEDDMPAGHVAQRSARALEAAAKKEEEARP